MPGDNIQRAVPDPGFVKLATPFDHHPTTGFPVFERRHRAFEIARVGKAIGPDGPARRQVEFLPVILAYKTARWPVQHLDPVHQSARQDRYFLRFQINHAQFGAKPQPPLLRNNQ